MHSAETVAAVQTPTKDQVSTALLSRAREFARRRGLKLGTVSDLCAGDGKFLSGIERGENFTIDRYQRAMDWLEANWPDEIAEVAHG